MFSPIRWTDVEQPSRSINKVIGRAHKPLAALFKMRPPPDGAS